MLRVACCVGSDHKGAFLLVHLLGVSVFSVCTRFHHQYRRRTDGYLYIAYYENGYSPFNGSANFDYQKQVLYRDYAGAV